MVSIRRLIALVLLVSLAPFAWAKDEADERLNAELCELMLGHTLRSVSATDFVFDVNKGLGLRGFLGSYPPANAQNAELAAKQGAFYWGHSMAVRRSVDEARAHDSQFHGLSKILYLISDVDVSDLNDNTPGDVVKARFQQIYPVSRLIYFEDIHGEQVLREVPADEAAKLIHVQKIEYFTRDDRGPRFTQSGWTFPKMRGVLTYQNVFQSGSETIDKLLRMARSAEKKGLRIRFNSDFQQALEKARDQVRLEKLEGGRLKAVSEGSRYLKETEFKLAQEGFIKGSVFSIEVWNERGQMVAGILGQRHDNIFSFDTIFYDFVERGSDRILSVAELVALDDAREAKSLIDYAKMAGLAGLLLLHDHGIDVSDAGMVTPFTRGLKGVYVPGDEFAGYIRDLQSRPPVKIDFSKPFSFLERVSNGK